MTTSFKKIFFSACLLLSSNAFAQSELIGNVYSRKITSLNGKWQYIIDPYETGFYGYRWTERSETDPDAYWNTDTPKNKTDKKEHGYSDKYSLNVPGDWNSQDSKFLYYEGTVWYKKSFDFIKKNDSNKLFLYFGAVNYESYIYLNGKKLGTHKGGFSPFNLEIPASLIKDKDNFLVVKVDNRRKRDEIPTLNTDWWNYGGITRDVLLVEVPQNFIRDYSIGLKKNSTTEVEGWIKFAQSKGRATLDIPELKFKKELIATSDSVWFSFKLATLKLWSPESPKLYDLFIRTEAENITDKIGFRNVEVKGGSILVNGKQVFLRGICLHEEVPQEGRRANTKTDALQLLRQAKELNANMVRLAHYPHNEHMIRTADSLGLFVWSEIPVYWTVNFTDPEVLVKAKGQLNDMIQRDKNRASIIIWSVGNETPVHPARTAFMSTLAATAKQLDSSRLISAALEVHNQNGTLVVDDPLGQYTDIVSVNEYLGWYGGLPSDIKKAKWDIRYNKPIFISETGAEALGGIKADSLTRWSEEYQEWFYKEQVAMMKTMPSNFAGVSPWILNDFRSPRRNNPVYQEGWNNKGLYDHNLNKKKAFYILKAYYDEKASAVNSK